MKKIVYFIIAIIISANIHAETISDVFPYGGETIYNQTTVTVKWSYWDSTDYVNIYLWNGGQSSFSLIDTNIAAYLSHYSWSVNESGYGDRFRIKVQSVNHPAIIGFSEGYFSIGYYQGQSTLVKENIAVKPHISFYPNPASASIEMNSANAQIKEILVWNSFGSLRQKINCNGASNLQIITESLENGVYYFEVNDIQNIKSFHKILIIK